MAVRFSKELYRDEELMCSRLCVYEHAQSVLLRCE